MNGAAESQPKSVLNVVIIYFLVLQMLPLLHHHFTGYIVLATGQFY